MEKYGSVWEGIESDADGYDTESPEQRERNSVDDAIGCDHDTNQRAVVDDTGTEVTLMAIRTLAKKSGIKAARAKKPQSGNYKVYARGVKLSKRAAAATGSMKSKQR